MGELRPARTLGPWTALALVVGNMIGSGIYLLPAPLAPPDTARLLKYSLVGDAELAVMTDPSGITIELTN